MVGDADDRLPFTAEPEGPTCHLGTQTCFGDESAPNFAVLADLATTIKTRRKSKETGSYTAKLLAEGIPRIAQKVGEEGLEVALAGAGEGDEQLIGESADLLFHLLVLLHERGLGLARVVAALRQRHPAPPPAQP